MNATTEVEVVYPLTKAIADLKKARTCLGCGKLFQSKSPANRICRQCKTATHWDDEEDPCEMQLRMPHVGHVDTENGMFVTGEGMLSGSLLDDDFTDDDLTDDDPTWELL